MWFGGILSLLFPLWLTWHFPWSVRNVAMNLVWHLVKLFSWWKTVVKSFLYLMVPFLLIVFSTLVSEFNEPLANSLNETVELLLYKNLFVPYLWWLLVWLLLPRLLGDWRFGLEPLAQTLTKWKKTLYSSKIFLLLSSVSIVWTAVSEMWW